MFCRLFHNIHQICKLRNSTRNLRKLPTRNLPCPDVIRHSREGAKNTQKIGKKDTYLFFFFHYMYITPHSCYLFLQRCIGKQRCAVTISNTNFGQDPCPNVLKRLSVEVVCAPATTAAEPNWRGWLCWLKREDFMKSCMTQGLELPTISNHRYIRSAFSSCIWWFDFHIEWVFKLRVCVVPKAIDS